MAFVSRREQFGRIESTQDAVRSWLDAGVPEVCLATADEQATGRGRAGRRWEAPPGSALLCSLGFRPTWLEPAAAWRLGAIASLAMADAAEDEAGMPSGAIRCKWPNDLVIEDRDAAATDGASPAAPLLRKVAGVLGESDGLGTGDPRVTVGIGINVDWAADRFPPQLAGSMTSLRAATGRPVARDALLETFIVHLEARVEALRRGRFPVDDWVGRQATTGRLVRLEGHGPVIEELVAVGVDPRTGALLVADAAVPGGERAVVAGEVARVRLVRSGDRPAGAAAVRGSAVV